MSEEKKEQMNNEKENEKKEQASELEELKQQLNEKNKEVEELKDKLLRVAAESENMKKRLEREKREFLDYANESLLKDILPIIDNLERAIEHASEEANIDDFIKGIEMTINSFKKTLEKYDVNQIESLHKPFDPEFHEAMSIKESEEFPPNTVIEEFQKGYTFKKRLLRPALVSVSKQPDKNGEN